MLHRLVCIKITQCWLGDHDFLILKVTSGSSGRVGGGTEKHLCIRLWQPSFLWHDPFATPPPIRYYKASYLELLYHIHPRTQYSSTGQLLSRETRPSADIHPAHPRESARPSLLLGTWSSPPLLICHDWSSRRASGIWCVSQSKMLGRIYFSMKKVTKLISSSVSGYLTENICFCRIKSVF